MSGYILKPAGRDVTCVMDWQRGYLAAGERVTADLGWSVQPDSGEAAELAVVEQRNDIFRSWAKLVGGIRGRVYLVSNRVRTNDDRVLQPHGRHADRFGLTPVLRSSR